MSRVLFLILVLANLGLFAWAKLYVAPGAPELAPSPIPGGQPLQLMSELTPNERKQLASVTPIPAPATAPAVAASTHAAPAAATGAAALPVQACVSYGPFPSAGAAGQGMTRLKVAGLTVSQRAVPGKAKLGYWVYLPPFRSRKEADDASDMLKKRGVKDIYVVTDEANRNAVSLGVFSQKDFAVQREKEIRKLGLKSQMAERFRDEARYWLDAKGADSVMPGADTFKDLGEDSAPVVRATTACAG
ncbi:MAG TPA: SPOR domain-containing protein [Gammaproteobacteria bacterium]|jgi:hypothetical protein